MPRPSRRDHLLDVAISLFAQFGFHATGIDRLAEVAGVSKKTIYAHFRSKDELILAALRREDSRFRNRFMRAVEASGSTAAARLLGVFDVAEAWFRQGDFFGCPFINAAGEFGSPASPQHQASASFKAMMRAYLLRLCDELLAGDGAVLAEELALLLEGAIVTAQVSGEPTAAKTAKRIAALLIEARTRETSAV